MHGVLENRGNGAAREGVSLEELCVLRREPLEESAARAEKLVKSGLATFSADGRMLFFTPQGQQRAREIVRNHRLWELYLTHEAKFAPDHVHDQAEEIEHLLGEETVRRLSRLLDYPQTDPHGRPIPSVEDVHGGAAAGREQGGLGYQ